MDGPYYTLLRWNKNIFGLYSVKFSRLLSSKNYDKVEKSYLYTKYKNKKLIQNNLSKGFLKFYPNFKKNFKFIKNLHSIRTINTNKNNEILNLIKNKNNFINVMSGKIDHIFYAYDQVIKCIRMY